jgi:hypothetical protein
MKHAQLETEPQFDTTEYTSAYNEVPSILKISLCCEKLDRKTSRLFKVARHGWKMLRGRAAPKGITEKPQRSHSC